jgi:glycosyltransferase involved in cell wall biosynthesis
VSEVLKPGNRILLLHSADEAYGSDRVLLSVATYLNQAEAQVRVLLPDDAPPGWLTDRLTEIGVDVRHGPLGIARRRYLSVSHLPKYAVCLWKARRFVLKEISTFDPEVVYVNTSAAIIGAFLGRRRRWSLVWHVHEIIEHPAWMAWLFRRWPLSADQVITVSGAVLQHLCGNRDAQGHVALLRNGISPRALASKPSLPPLRVCFAGRLSEWKGYRVFLDAAIELASHDTSIEFVIAGEPVPNELWRNEELRSMIDRRGLANQIRVVGFHSDVPGLFDSVHVVVVPSILPDPLPTVVLEGMRSGCVVIAARHGGAVEMIEDGVSGILVTPGDSVSLQRAILRVRNEPGLIEAIGAAARARVESEFTTEVFWRNLSPLVCRAIDVASKRRNQAGRNGRALRAMKPNQGSGQFKIDRSDPTPDNSGTSRDLRVLMIVDWFVNYSAPIAVSLQETADVRCVLKDHGTELGLPGRANREKAAMFAPVRVSFVPGKQFDLRSLGALVRVIAEVRRFQPDVIHSQWHSDWRLLLLSLAVPRSSRILTVHDVTPHPGRQFHTSYLKRLVRWGVYRSCDGFVVHGERLVPLLREDRRVPASAYVGVIPHGSLAHRAERYPLPRERRLLFFGWWEYYKGLDLLIEAMESAAKILGDVRLIIAGQGSEGPRARALVQTPELFDWREGYVPDKDLPTLFGSVGAVVLPYREASQSGVVPLAFAMGRPAIATDVGALGEAVEDGVNGLLVKSPTVEGIRDAIVRLFTEPGLLGTLASGAQKTADEALRPETIAREHQAVYAAVAAAKVRRPC